jgi:hypothetical protein
MTIYILIILAIYTIIGILTLIVSAIEGEEAKDPLFLIGIFILLTGIIAMVFQGLKI